MQNKFELNNIKYDIPMPEAEGYVFSEYRTAKKGEWYWDESFPGKIVFVTIDHFLPSWIATKLTNRVIQ